MDDQWGSLADMDGTSQSSGSQHDEAHPGRCDMEQGQKQKNKKAAQNKKEEQKKQIKEVATREIFLFASFWCLIS